jgi:hypothetical protein
MELLSNTIPESIRIEISENTEKLWPSKKVFTIGFLRRDTCEILEALFATIAENVLNAEHARQTKFALIEENRKILSMILAVAVFNFHAEYSKKVFRFIERNTTGHELLALIYLVKRQLALFVDQYCIDEINKYKIVSLLYIESEKQIEVAKQAFEKSKQDSEEMINRFNKQRRVEKQKLSDQIKQHSNKYSRLTIIHGA